MSDLLLCDKSPQTPRGLKQQYSVVIPHVSIDLELGRGLAGTACLCSMVLESQLEDSRAGAENHRKAESRMWCSMPAELSARAVHGTARTGCALWPGLPRSVAVPRVSGARETVR